MKGVHYTDSSCPCLLPWQTRMLMAMAARHGAVLRTLDLPQGYLWCDRQHADDDSTQTFLCLPRDIETAPFRASHPSPTANEPASTVGELAPALVLTPAGPVRSLAACARPKRIEAYEAELRVVALSQDKMTAKLTAQVPSI